VENSGKSFSKKMLWKAEKSSTFFSTGKIKAFQGFYAVFHIFFPYCVLLLKKLSFFLYRGGILP